MAVRRRPVTRVSAITSTATVMDVRPTRSTNLVGSTELTADWRVACIEGVQSPLQLRLKFAISATASRHDSTEIVEVSEAWTANVQSLRSLNGGSGEKAFHGCSPEASAGRAPAHAAGARLRDRNLPELSQPARK